MISNNEIIGKDLRIAIAHDYLTQKGGAERVVLTLHKAFPNAPIYTNLYDPEGTFPEFKSAVVRTSPLNRIPLFRRDHRIALPLLALSSSLMKVDADIVITSTSGWAHGFRKSGSTITYCHTPARWLYLTDEYLGREAGLSKKMAIKLLAPLLRVWDQKAAKQAGRYIANSTVVQRRILEVYGKRAPIVFPPHSVEADGELRPVPGIREDIHGNYLLVVSRLMPYKNVDIAICAAKLAGRDIVVVGRGPERASLQREFGNDAVFLSDLSEAELRYVYAGASYLIAPSFEDFGITPLEAAAWGVPTIALKSGGYLDTVIEEKTGIFFEKPEPQQIAQAIDTATKTDWDQATIREHASKFNEQRFILEIKDQIDRLGGVNSR